MDITDYLKVLLKKSLKGFTSTMPDSLTGINVHICPPVELEI